MQTKSREKPQDKKLLGGKTNTHSSTGNLNAQFSILLLLFNNGYISLVTSYVARELHAAPLKHYCSSRG
jgi:hypothetical protein